MLIIIELKKFFNEFIDDRILTLDLLRWLYPLELIGDNCANSVIKVIPYLFERSLFS